MFDPEKAKKRKKTKPKSGRRASPVKVSFLPQTRRIRRAQMISQHPIFVRENARADFAELRPENVHPWDWNQMYVDERELWPTIIEEAQHAVEQGELQTYARRR